MLGRYTKPDQQKVPDKRQSRNPPLVLNTNRDIIPFIKGKSMRGFCAYSVNTS